ncbi:MAG: GntR family transcriptional regulator [Pseudomonadota bacterium]|nr:GntR family transcriptional regulator [Pseudomonadota bacterium]
MSKAKTVAKVQPRKSLTMVAYEQLEELITTLKLEPGTVLSEAALVDQLGIGRTPIREALQKLEREGLILILPRKGIQVTDINPRKQLLLLELRRELEKLLARTGALRATDTERLQFESIADAMENTIDHEDHVGFMRQDYALNQLISKAGHNEYASRAIGLIQGLARRFWFMHRVEAADMTLCTRLHAELARSIARGSPDDAENAVDALLDYLETFTRATVDPNLLSR